MPCSGQLKWHSDYNGCAEQEVLLGAVHKSIFLINVSRSTLFSDTTSLRVQKFQKCLYQTTNFNIFLFFFKCLLLGCPKIDPLGYSYGLYVCVDFNYNGVRAFVVYVIHRQVITYTTNAGQSNVK